jgi:hypothetical protein
MANIAAYMEKAMLDWGLGGATPTRPAAWAIGLSLGSPTSISGSEITTGSGYARQTGIFGAAASPAGSASNNSACTFGPFSGAASVSGLQVWDSMLSLNSGNMLYEGLLATARTIGVGDSLVLAVGALTIALS